MLLPLTYEFLIMYHQNIFLGTYVLGYSAI
jgi:hypothetical protein